MNLTTRHRKIARTIWECGGRLDEVAQRQSIRTDTLRKWLADPDFRALLSQDAIEPVLQATSAMLRWAPVAVSRLIQDLDGGAPADARQAAREILKLALDTQRELAQPVSPPRGAGDKDDGGSPFLDDPLARRVAALSDEQLARILGILNEPARASQRNAASQSGQGDQP